WTALDAVAADVQVGDDVLIDTTNPFGGGGFVGAPGGVPSAEYNARRFATKRLVKTFNTYTSSFQAEVGDGRHPAPVAMFLGGEDAHAKQVAARLVRGPGVRPRRPRRRALDPAPRAPPPPRRRLRGGVHPRRGGPHRRRRHHRPRRGFPSRRAAEGCGVAARRRAASDTP